MFEWRGKLRKYLQTKMKRQGGEVRLPIRELTGNPAKQHAIIDIAGEVARKQLEPLPGTSLQIERDENDIVYRLPQMPVLPK